MRKHFDYIEINKETNIKITNKEYRPVLPMGRGSGHASGVASLDGDTMALEEENQA